MLSLLCLLFSQRVLSSVACASMILVFLVNLCFKLCLVSICFYEMSKDFCGNKVYYSVLTTKNSVSIPHHTVDHLYQFHPHLPHPALISPLLTTTLVSVSCVWWVRLGLFIYLFCLFFCIPHKSKIIWYFSFSI